MSVVVVLILLVSAAPALASDSCISCHLELGDSLGEPSEIFVNDIHHQVGLSCASCHGGDPSNNDMEGAKGSDTGYVGAPGFKGISDLCGSCHSSAEFMRQYNPSLRIDQVSEYRTSVHGKLGAEGHTDVATCISCHSVHDIRKVNDPLSPTYPTKVADTCGSCHSDPKRMEAHGVPHNQVAEYRTSVHALALFEKRDLSAPTCNDCHGNHGAVPPQAASVAQVCGNCHGTQRSLFQQSPHGEMFTLMDLAGCVTCHGNHAVAAADESQLVGEDAVCSACHESDQGSEAADSMATQLVRLQERIKHVICHSRPALPWFYIGTAPGCCSSKSGNITHPAIGKHVTSLVFYIGTAPSGAGPIRERNFCTNSERQRLSPSSSSAGSSGTLSAAQRT